MTTDLPEELLKEMSANPKRPVRIESNGRVFYIMTDHSLNEMVEDNTRAAIEEGLDEIQSGKSDEWSVADIKQRGRQRLTNNC